MTFNATPDCMTKEIASKLMVHFGKTPEEATNSEIMEACAFWLRDKMAIREVQTRKDTAKSNKKQVHYLSLEFLMGRSLMKNAYNLGVLDKLNIAITMLGKEPAEVFEAEPDAALGNGGLGRLAACYMDSMATLEIPAVGYSICYELGIFKQEIKNGEQIELPDPWRTASDAWLLPKYGEAQEVLFGGTVSHEFVNGHRKISYEGATKVLAVPHDMLIAGFNTDHTNHLRLWNARATKPLDMALFSKGEYTKALEERDMAESICKVLYPNDNHPEGKTLRMRQQYFFVSATCQSVVKKHLAVYGTLANFAEYNVFQINDTHPTLVIPELMRIFMDEHGMEWNDAWKIVTNAVAYTNHTVMWEALERWPQSIIQNTVPRIWEIIVEIARRWQATCSEYYNGNMEIVKNLGICWDNEVRMANLCIAGGKAVNGVSTLHSNILREDVFKYACQMNPSKFKNVTNGIDHRRWMSQINPELDALVKELLGSDEFLTNAMELQKLNAFANDQAVLDRLSEIKYNNKLKLCKFVKAAQGIELNPNSLFDVQAKRLHEYKRQLLNVLHIITLYHRLKDDPNSVQVPRTFLFGAKAAPGYVTAKRIIQLINSLAAHIDADPLCQGKLKVVFLENYRVTLAESLIPAADVSEQISTAGKEASGTGNMKFMINGALTVGTLDGANVEMHDVLGDENMFLFGLHANEVVDIKAKGYNPRSIYDSNSALKRCLDQINIGFSDGISYSDIYGNLLNGFGGSADQYLLLADYEAYIRAQDDIAATYQDKNKWNRMCLKNIAEAGIFAADRAVGEYADNIWNVEHRLG